MRILGIDFGRRTIGIAISDENGLLARGLKAIPKNTWERELPGLIREYQVKVLVVGLPKTMANAESAETKMSIRFIEKLRQMTDCRVVKWDERLTSRLAERYLLSADLSRAKRKKVIDRLSAQIILQDYLDFVNQPGQPLKEAEEI